MQKKLIFRLGLTATLIIATLLLLSGLKPAANLNTKGKKSTCCTKKLPVNSPGVCTPGPEKKGSGEMVIENLSQQFISIRSGF